MKPLVPPPVAPRARLKTYSHLSGAERLPNEYELGTSRLLYYVERGFAVTTPLASFYRAHQAGSPLGGVAWEAFSDPRQTTYARYTALMSQREAFVARLFARIEESDYDAALPAPALALHDELLAPLRFAGHGLQMLAAYAGQMAPAGKIVVVLALQAADEVRRIQHLAYRLGLLRRRHPELGARAAWRWQEEARWQPLRRVVEELLVVWDWGESFAALCLALKPIFDELTLVLFAERARDLGDYLTAELLGALREDARWHRDWADALVTLALGHAPNRAPLTEWTGRWGQRALAAAVALAPGDDGVARLRGCLDQRLAALAAAEATRS